MKMLAEAYAVPARETRQHAMGQRSRESVRIACSEDGVKIAWAAIAANRGPTLVKVPAWLTHLDHDWESPVWQHWTQFLAQHYRYIRYDERGCGMSQRAVDVSVEGWLADLAAVIAAASPVEPVALLATSHGAAAAIRYAVEHPARVSHLILYGAYARGDEDDALEQSVIELVRQGWSSANPVYRQLFTSRFIPGASHEQLRWWNDLCRHTTSGEMAARMLEAQMRVDVRDLLPRVTTPTLVLHARGDEIVPFAQGQLVASSIPNARFIELDSSNHVLLAGEPAWQRFEEEVVAFTGTGAPTAESVFRALSLREHEVLKLMMRGLANVDIGRSLFISEKTVRNHITKIFDKLGVHSRTQAIVVANDHRYGD